MKIAMISAIQNLSGNMVSAMIDKIGFGSIAAVVGLRASEQAGVIVLASDISDAWSMADWALLFSIIGTVLFCIKTVFEIRLIRKKSKKIKDEDQS